MMDIKKSKFLKSIMYILLYLGAFIIVRNVIISLFQLVYTNILVKKGTSGQSYSELASYLYIIIKQNINIIIIITNTITLLIYLIIDKIRKNKILWDISINKENIKYTTCGILIAICLNVIFTCIINYFNFARVFSNFGKEANMLFSGDNIYMVIISVGIVAPVFEELLFRGIILRELKGNCSLVLAILIQAILFGIWHGEILTGINAFILAIILALFYIRTKSLIVPIFIHSSYNLCSIVIKYHIGKDTIVTQSFLLVPICSFLILLVLLFIRFKKKTVKLISS